MLPFVISLTLSASATTARADDAGIRAITVTTDTMLRKIPIAVTPAVFTALRISEPFDLETVSFGKPAWF